MTQPVSRAVVEAFYEAFGARDHDRTAAFLADDVDLDHQRPGRRAEVLRDAAYAARRPCSTSSARKMSAVVRRRQVRTSSALLVDGDQVVDAEPAVRQHQEDGRIISYRLAHFSRFRDGKMVENLSLLDSFDAVEQVLGHPLATSEQAPAAGDLIAV